MALTKAQALDKFCIRQGYDTNKLEGETKLQFYARRTSEVGKSWAIGEVKLQIQEEKEAEARAAVDSDVTGLDI